MMMGYCVTVDGANFKIVAENMNVKNFSHVDSLQDEGWCFGYDSDWNVIDISYERENYHSDHITIFEEITSSVTPGSYITFYGEDGKQWRWFFDGHSVKRIVPTVIYEMEGFTQKQTETWDKS